MLFSHPLSRLPCHRRRLGWWNRTCPVVKVLLHSSAVCQCIEAKSVSSLHGTVCMMKLILSFWLFCGQTGSSSASKWPGLQKTLLGRGHMQMMSIFASFLQSTVLIFSTCYRLFVYFHFFSQTIWIFWWEGRANTCKDFWALAQCLHILLESGRAKWEQASQQWGRSDSNMITALLHCWCIHFSAPHKCSPAEQHVEQGWHAVMAQQKYRGIAVVVSSLFRMVSNAQLDGIHSLWSRASWIPPPVPQEKTQSQKQVGRKRTDQTMNSVHLSNAVHPLKE